MARSNTPPEDVQNLSGIVPGRELTENAAEYDRRVQEFKKQQPNFSALVDQPTEIPVSAHDQILRMRNELEIALFLSFAPEVCSHLCKMDPVRAAETIENISDDLDWAIFQPERVGYSVWKEARNREKAPRARGKRWEHVMSEYEKPKKPTSVDVLSQAPRRQTYGPEHGSGSPNLDPGELQNSKAWKEHKPAKQVKPKEK